MLHDTEAGDSAWSARPSVMNHGSSAFILISAHRSTTRQPRSGRLPAPPPCSVDHSDQRLTMRTSWRLRSYVQVRSQIFFGRESARA